MDKSKYRILKHPIVKNLSVLVSGTVIAQLIVIGFQLILSRQYTPADFGAFAVYMSVVGIVLTISSLRYEQAIVLPKADSDGVTLTKLSIAISLIVALVFAAFLYLFSSQFINLIGLQLEYKDWLIFLPISIFLFSVLQALNYLLIRLSRFSLSGNNKWIRRLIEGAIQSSFGIFGKGIGLILGDIIAHIIVIGRTIFKINSKSLNKSGSTKTTKELLKQYADFPLKSTLPSLLNAFSRLLPIIIISRIFSAEITGLFHYARLVLLIPLSLVTVSLNQVLLQQFSKKRNQRLSIKKDVGGLVLVLATVSVLLIIFIKLFGVEIFSIVFGQAWADSGMYAEILVWAFALKFLVSPFNSSFIAFEKISIGSVWQVFYFVLVASIFFINFTSIEQFLKYYVAMELIAFIAAGIINFIILYRYEQGLKIKA